MGPCENRSFAISPRSNMVSKAGTMLPHMGQLSIDAGEKRPRDGKDTGPERGYFYISIDRLLDGSEERIQVATVKRTDGFYIQCTDLKGAPPHNLTMKFRDTSTETLAWISEIYHVGYCYISSVHVAPGGDEKKLWSMTSGAADFLKLIELRISLL